MQQIVPRLSTDQFARLARIVYEDSGIFLAESKHGLLTARINSRLRALGLGDYAGYCEFLDGPGGAAERRRLLVAITTNVTAFFREAHHFALLAETILPPLIARAKSGGRVRLWSSACSSGEEAYSIAMIVLERFPEAARYDFRILATDIDPEMIARAKQGEYDGPALRDLSENRRTKFFTEIGGRFHTRAVLKKLLCFGELNLHGDWPFSRRFDVIFCRNVVIYFDIPTRQRLWKRFAELLYPEGYLMIGHSERIDGPAAARFRSVGTTAYQVVPATT